MKLRLIGINFGWTGWFELVGKAHLGSNHATLVTLAPCTELVYIYVILSTHQVTFIFHISPITIS